MSAYQPELGQMIFGQPHQEYEVPQILTAALDYLGREIERVVWNQTQTEFASPRDNCATAFRCDAFGMWAYSWSDEEQPYNFHHPKSGLMVSWYKWGGRGESANMLAPPELVSDVLIDCLTAVRACDENDRWFLSGYGSEVPYFSAAQSPVASPDSGAQEAQKGR